MQLKVLVRIIAHFHLGSEFSMAKDLGQRPLMHLVVCFEGPWCFFWRATVQTSEEQDGMSLLGCCVFVRII